MSSNYPDGVTGMEPQISGIIDPQGLENIASDDIDKASKLIESLACTLDDQGCLPDWLNDEFDTVLTAIDDLGTQIYHSLPSDDPYDDPRL
jgi:hypothetical protein